MKSIFFILMFVSFAQLSACSGGSSDTKNEDCIEPCNLQEAENEQSDETLNTPDTVDNFSLPKSIHVVETPESALLARFDDSGTEYMQTHAQTWVSLPSFNGIENINLFLCFLDLLNFEDYVNAGPYIALLDNSQCKNSNPNLIEGAPIIVNVTQESPTSPRKFDIWREDFMINDPVMASPISIFVHGEITEGVSETNPRGDFTFVSEFRYQDGSLHLADEFKSTQIGNEHSYLYFSEVRLDPEPMYIGQSITINSNGFGSSDYFSELVGSYRDDVELAFNDTAVLVQVLVQELPTALRCFDQNDVTEYLHDAALFDANTGEQITYDWMDALFFFEYTDGPDTFYGVADYEGVRIWDSANADYSIFNVGYTVTRKVLNFSTGQAESAGQFTLTMPSPVNPNSNGKITNYSIQNTLGEILTLETPASFSYAHSDENDRNGNASDTALYDYVNLDYLNMEMNVKDGVIVGDSNQYVLKAISLEYKLAEVALNHCDGLSISPPLEPVPTGISANADMIIDTLPPIPGSVSVINGVNQ